MTALSATSVRAQSIGSDSSDDWSPYRRSVSTPEAKAKRAASQEVRWDAPVRVANYEQPSNDSVAIDGANQDASDFGTSRLEASGNLGDPSLRTSAGDEQAASFNQFTHGGSSMGYVNPVPSHRVIRAPNRNLSSHQGSSQGEQHAGLGLRHHLSDSDQEHLPPPPLHGEHTKFNPKKWIGGPVQNRPATIPNAKQTGTWKQPYSYGYFGGSGTRHWSKNYGYRDRTTEFRYR
ncbi:hypothetical protein [Rubripirellula amarantea]|uniref:hypothetical protein n=1 Tax=Rubripirellula amarantea TaxID=2527999 RepID=UPI0011B5F450|nr:hypothetical protein [Rubripirellula amarantea]